MVDVTEILVHWHAGRSLSEIAESLGVERKTVRTGGAELASVPASIIRTWLLADAKEQGLVSRNVAENISRVAQAARGAAHLRDVDASAGCAGRGDRGVDRTQGREPHDAALRALAGRCREERGREFESRCDIR